MKTLTDESTASISGTSFKKERNARVTLNDTKEENFESTIDEDLLESPPHTKNINAFGRFKSHLAVNYNQTPKSINF